jgi:outer membrane protein OmpA-like peptidoglycan-associated protein
VGAFVLLTLFALAVPAAADGDGDGVPDSADKCPTQAETYNGYQDGDGCPDLSQPPPAGKPTQLIERVPFAHDSAELRPTSFALLDAIAIVVRNQPQLFPTVALEGHAADNERAPMKLSLARASAVRVALIARGVDADRLLARASGNMAPVCSEQNESCRVRERTVEFVTLVASREGGASAAEKPTADGEPAPPRPAASDQPPAAATVPLERIEFKKGSAVIGPSALGTLDIVAGFMKATPASLEILGYADSDERRALARARAEAVRAYMRACGVSDQNLTARAESAARCRSGNDACRARNRRAELRFVEAPAEAATAAPPPSAAAPDR